MKIPLLDVAQNFSDALYKPPSTPDYFIGNQDHYLVEGSATTQ